MATWHQERAGLAGLYRAPDKGHAVVINPPHGLACRVDFSRKRDAARYARKTGGRIISAAPKPKAAPRPLVRFLNWRGPAGRETVDELRREDFPAGREGAKAFRLELARLCSEYALAGMAVYPSSRPCAGWSA